MLPGFARDTVTIVRPGMIVDHGTQTSDWDNPTLIPVSRCSVQPGYGAINGDRRMAVESDLSVWMPAGADIRGTDRVRVPGYSRDFVVRGEPERWTSVMPHVVAHLNVWEG